MPTPHNQEVRTSLVKHPELRKIQPQGWLPEVKVVMLDGPLKGKEVDVEKKNVTVTKPAPPAKHDQSAAGSEPAPATGEGKTDQLADQLFEDPNLAVATDDDEP